MPHLGALLMSAAQVTTSTTSFEVATIRANLSGIASRSISRGGAGGSQRPTALSAC